MALLDELYIITCTDLHGAVGLFVGLESAVKMARKLTGMKEHNKGCVFLPVKIDVLGGAKMIDSNTSGLTDTVEPGKMDRGYL